MSAEGFLGAPPKLSLTTPGASARVAFREGDQVMRSQMTTTSTLSTRTTELLTSSLLSFWYERVPEAAIG
jgi:hypothetical protein